MTGLLRTQQVAGTPDLQIPHGDLKPAAQLRKFTDGGQTLLRHFLQHFVSAVHQKGIGSTIRTAHAAP